MPNTNGTGLHFLIEPESLFSSQIAADIEKEVLAALDNPDGKQPMVRKFAVLLSCTSGVEVASERVKPAAKKALEATVRLFDPALSAVQRWDLYQHVPYVVLSLWTSQFEDASNPFEPDPAALPMSALTDEQRAEAETPNSPLTSPAAK